MKRFISMTMAIVLTFGVCLGNNATKVSAQETNNTEKSSPILDNYSVNKEYIEKGDVVDIKFNIADENIKRNITLQNSYVEMTDNSSFTYIDSGVAFTSNAIESDKDKCGGQISFELKNCVYQSEGHRLSMIYGFDLEGSKYQNLISFEIEQTMREVPKTEGEIKEFELIPEDKQRGGTPKTNKVEEINADNVEEIENADARVADAQRWLNARYGGKPGYIKIPEDGVPGTRVATAFVRGLQIDLGIPSPTGTFGDATKVAFERQVGCLNRGSTDSGGKQYVSMLQHAMFCKGYSPGSVSGSYGDNTANGIMKMKRDAGFSDISDPQVNSMWMQAVLNSDAYVLVNKGDAKIRSAQQYLNKNYYNYFGIQPCDGHYSRDTNKAVIYAWQAEEGLDPQTANGRFGPTTKARCPNLPNDSRYSSATLKRFTLIMQFTLYFNKEENSAHLNFIGNYDAATANSVRGFQNFMCLPTRSGLANVGTIMSLMVSTGDTDRSALGCDCATKLDAGKVSALYRSGYRYVGRYLTNVPGGRDKMMDNNEFHTISHGGLRVFPIFQQGGEDKSHFSEAQGRIDAKLAVDAMRNLNIIKQDAIIYFAVDYDFMDFEVTNQVLPYFLGVNDVINRTYSGEYKIGVYGSRNICTRVSDAGFATTSFVSDMSTGYSGNYGYSMPKNWAFDQFCEYTFSGFGLDKDAVSGRDQGVSLNTKYSGYNRGAARAYMAEWSYKRNEAYYSYGADCANYVSQCLHAGGIPMNGIWYSHKTGNEKADEILDAESASFEVGDPWRLAKKQFNFFSFKPSGYMNGDVVRINRTDDIASIISQCRAQGNPIKVGDLMYFANDSKGGAHHATIISEIDGNMIYYSAHTDNYEKRSLTDGFKNSPNNEYVYIIRIKDSN